jgi:hypothetical protein
MITAKSNETPVNRPAQDIYARVSLRVDTLCTLPASVGDEALRLRCL